MLSPARDTALEVLMQISGANAWSDGSLKRTISQNGLDSRDAALATRLAYGVIQNRLLLDYYIGCYCSQRPGHLEAVVLNILRIGAYQILFMDKIPHRAAVNEAVEMVKRHGRPKASGLVNAVLRKFVTNWLDMPALPDDAPASYLSIRYSHPQWLVQRLLDQIGEDETERFLRCNNEIVPTTIQTNCLRCSDDELEKELHLSDAAAERHPWLDGCLQVSGTGDLEQLPAFQKGHFWVQDAAARLVAVAAQARPGYRVMDVCAAPGGKSFALAVDMGDRGEILSCDIHPHKLKLLENSVARLGFSSIRTALADGREPHTAWLGQADLVVADVPCSGLGIIRKKPDIRYKPARDLAALPDIQRSILDNASTYVCPGGVLLYSTCTVLRAENEAVTEDFLACHPDFAQEPFELPGPIGWTSGQITLWPQQYGTDGFYICRMRKSN
ncbi:MAG: 16S rRNA (cytosine(967)-C(5))-methyltransferase RsmB [Ruminococcaceae bacterium]|jgi:16S rRNA (cytosine967-C5)-methyltransferase|nr:16S rRNA (cytosine(967)-C(5))-methyltransferase RsmB [Oscillospiraceae bacterium]